MSNRAKNFLTIAKNWSKIEFYEKIFFLPNFEYINAINVRKKISYYYVILGLIFYHWATFRRLFLIYSQEFSTGDHIFLAQFFMKFLVVQVLFFLKLPENWPFLLIKVSKKLSKNVVFSAWNFLHRILCLIIMFYNLKTYFKAIKL